MPQQLRPRLPRVSLSLLDLDASDTSTDTALAVPLAHVTLISDESDPLDPVSPDLQHALVMDDSHQVVGSELLSSSV